MNIYFSGLGGVGIGPLAEIAHDAGNTVTGSDLAESRVTAQLRAKGINLTIGQTGEYLEATHRAAPLDWFVYTSALPSNHPELVAAQTLGIRTGKRDEFLAEFLKAQNLKLIAISGTHGKTTTTGMAVWAFKQLGIPVSYSVGTTVSFGASGAYQPGSEYFVYECDEYDRNLLHFSPCLSLLTSIDYDHPDTYPTEDDYKATFRQYVSQSSHTIAWKKDIDYITQPTSNATTALNPDDTAQLKLAGAHNRRNATLVLKGLEYLGLTNENTIEILNDFPGTDRRFEKLATNLYSDYGHHPEEIAATLQLASELSNHIVLIYQPHQNWRQHFIRNQYTNQFEQAELIYWVPTYLTRENPNQPTLQPQELTTHVTNQSSIVYTELNDELWNKVKNHLAEGKLVLSMGAGPIDGWVRQKLTEEPNSLT